MIQAKLMKYLAAIGGFVLLVLGVFLKGKSVQREEQKLEDLEEYKETKERIEDVETSPDRDSAIDRLRRNGRIR